MKREKIRLRPTGLWILFGPILGCMWLAAINYSNNLVYGILYLVASLTFVSIFHTWRNLASLEAEHVRVHSAFAGGEVRMEIYLRNPGKLPVYGLFFARQEDGRSVSPLGLPGGMRVRAGDTRLVELTFPAARRGVYRFDALLVRSSFPFGLVTAGFRLPINADYFVYPEPKGDPLLPGLRLSGEDGSPVGTKPGDDFNGVRAYMPGESLRHIDWKAFARGRPLSVKQFTGGEGNELWLDGAELAELPLEERLSQLTLWVVKAEKEDIPYVLRYGSAIVPAGLGPEHSRQALQMLAITGARA